MDDSNPIIDKLYDDFRALQQTSRGSPEGYIAFLNELISRLNDLGKSKSREIRQLLDNYVARYSRDRDAIAQAGYRGFTEDASKTWTNASADLPGNLENIKDVLSGTATVIISPENKYSDNLPGVKKDFTNSDNLPGVKKDFTNSELSIQKRYFHTLLSKHRLETDRSIADILFQWLKGADIRTWYDADDAGALPPGSSIEKELPNVIVNCRSIILILSKISLATEWIQKQYQTAKEQKERHKEFRILPIQIDESKLPPDFAEMGDPIDLRHRLLDLDTANRLLLGLYYNNIETGFERQDIYISRTWREVPEAEPKLADHVCRVLISKGFRLIGDSKDQKGFYGKDDQERIGSIVSSCGGLVAILPDRGRVENTSDYAIREIQIALEHEIPCLIITEPNVQLPDQLDKVALRLASPPLEKVDETKLQRNIVKLKEEWKKPSKPHYLFFATDFTLGNKKRNRLIKEHIQRITSMECTIGDDIQEVPIQQAIIDKISHAFGMIADISEGNTNTIIEAGIAIGAGLKESLHLIASGPRRDTTFMFSDKEVLYYADESELLGIIHKIAYRYRRRVLNYELSS